jgi:hypothetical protein
MSRHPLTEKRTTSVTKLAKIRIIAVRERSLRFRKGDDGSPQICRMCPEKSPMLSPDLAAAISGLRTRAIYHLVETGEIHYQEEEGILTVCLKSLMDRNRSSD